MRSIRIPIIRIISLLVIKYLFYDLIGTLIFFESRKSSEPYERITRPTKDYLVTILFTSVDIYVDIVINYYRLLTSCLYLCVCTFSNIFIFYSIFGTVSFGLNYCGTLFKHVLEGPTVQFFPPIERDYFRTSV